MSKSPIVARINALLSLKGISKKQFFKDCKISSSAFSQWNTGKIEVPRGKNIERIANYLEVSVEYLLYGDMQEVQAKKSAPVLAGRLADRAHGAVRHIAPIWIWIEIAIHGKAPQNRRKCAARQDQETASKCPSPFAR